MPRGRPRKETAPSSLALAVDFCKYANRESNEVYAQHVLFINGYAYRFDGIMSAAYPCTDALNVCPNFERFNAALARVGTDVEIIQDAEKVLVKGKKLTAYVPAISPQDYTALPPDMPRVGVDNNDFRGYMARLAKLASDTSEHVLTSSILLHNGYATATDRIAMLQTWCGVMCDVPLVVPRMAIAAVLKTNMPINGFGWSEQSCTFWYENGAFLRTQLYGEPWPDGFDRVLPTNEDYEGHHDLPKDFYEAVDAVMALTDDGNVYLSKEGVSSHPPGTPGASLYKTKLPVELVKVSGKRIMLLQDFADKAYLDNGNLATFFGEKFRACVSHIATA